VFRYLRTFVRAIPPVARKNDQDKEKKITLKLISDVKVIEITFEGVVDESESEQIINSAFDFLNSSRVQEIFKKPNFVVETSKPTITLNYNKLTKQI
jgi:hypothetical protein